MASALLANSVLLLTLCLYLFALCFFFVIIGMESFGGSLQGRCVLANTTTPIFNEGLATWTFCSADDTAYKCATSLGHECDLKYGNPFHGQQNFDDFWSGMLVVFQLATASNWITVSEALVDSVSPMMVGYSVFLIILINLVMPNVFLAVVQYSFGQMRDHQKLEEARLLAEKTQQGVISGEGNVEVEKVENMEENEVSVVQVSGEEGGNVDLNENMQGTGAQDHDQDETESCGSKRILSLAPIVTSPTYESVIIFIILLNSIAMMMDHSDMSQEEENISNILEVTFSSIFVVDVSLRLAGLGITTYFQSSMNRFDFTITVVSGISAYNHNLGTSFTDGLGAWRDFAALRALRALRAVRLLRFYKPVWNIAESLLGGAEHLIRIFVSLMLFVIVFATLGTHAFGGHRIKGESGLDLIGSSPYGDRVNFDTFRGSVLVLLQVLTKDSWEFFMYDAQRDGQNKWLSFFYFAFYYCVVNYLAMALLISAILESLMNHEEQVKEAALEEALESVDKAVGEASELNINPYSD